MVPYYNPASVPMFGRSGSSYHHHHHHSPPTQNHPYFTPGAYGAGYHHHNPHSHHASHQAAAASGPGGSGSPVGAGLGVGSAGLPSSVSSTQFSPSVTTDFNCNHQYNPPYANMTPDSMAVAAAAAAAASSQWSQTSMYSSACAAARNVAAVAAGLSSVGPPPPPPPAPHGSSYEEWSNLTGGHPHPPHHMHPHAYQHHSHHLHPSFYNHHATSQQPSPPSSTPSSPSSSHSPSHHVFSTSSTTPNNNNSSNNNNTPTFKAEFGPCSDGNNQTSTDVKPHCISFKQEASSQEMQQTNQGNTTSVSAVTSGGPSIGTPHSPDSGMAISDGVSSSGSPATNNGQQFHQPQHCLGGPSSNSSGSSSTNHSSNANNNGGNNGTGNAGTNGSDNSQQQQFNSSGGNMVHGMGSHHHGHGIHMSNIHQNSGNLNHHHHSHHQSLVNSHQNGIINVTSSGRPTQARSPYEWIKKQPYSSSCSGGNPASNNAKTRTKDKYRVVYSDTQRLELEKEFHFNRYITIRRKSDLASTLGLSERQVKIWFQNRRAKERKSCRKQEEIVKRERIATMVHMHNAVAAVGGMGGGMCNQTNLPNNGVPLSALM